MIIESKVLIFNSQTQKEEEVDFTGYLYEQASPMRAVEYQIAKFAMEQAQQQAARRGCEVKVLRGLKLRTEECFYAEDLKRH